MPDNIIMADPKGWTTEQIASNKAPTGDIVLDGVQIGNYAFASKPISSILSKNADVSPTAFEGCYTMRSAHIEFPAASYGTRSYFMKGCSHLEVAVCVFHYTGAVAGFTLESLLYDCASIRAVDLTNTGYYTNANTLCGQLTIEPLNASSLCDTIILRGPDGRKWSAKGIGINKVSKFKEGGGGGTLYVPRASMQLYIDDSYWGPILARSNNSIVPIEDSIYATQYADGTPISPGG